MFASDCVHSFICATLWTHLPVKVVLEHLNEGAERVTSCGNGEAVVVLQRHVEAAVGLAQLQIDSVVVNNLESICKVIEVMTTAYAS